jgi:tetratricopeptide (TPR) repeat protein
MSERFIIIIVYESNYSILPQLAIQKPLHVKVEASPSISLFSNSQQDKRALKRQSNAIKELFEDFNYEKKLIWLIPNELKEECLNQLKHLSNDKSLYWPNYDEGILENLGINKEAIIDGIIEGKYVTEEDFSSEKIKFLNILKLEKETKVFCPQIPNDYSKTHELIQNLDTKITKLEERLDEKIKAKPSTSTQLIVGIIIGLVLAFILFFNFPSLMGYSKTSDETPFKDINSKLDENTKKLYAIQNLIKKKIPEDVDFSSYPEEPTNGNESQAEESDKELQLKSNDYWGWYNRGIALSNLDHYEEAIKSYNKALKVKPNHYWSLYNRSVALRKSERYEEAIDSYKKALKIDLKIEHQFWCWYELASVLSKLKRYQEAVNSYKKALRIKPRHKDVQNELEIALKKLKKN